MFSEASDMYITLLSLFFSFGIKTGGILRPVILPQVRQILTTFKFNEKRKKGTVQSQIYHFYVDFVLFS